MRKFTPWRLAVIPIALALLAGGIAPAADEVSQAITTAEIKAHIAFLTAPERAGRQPGSRGWQEAQAYIKAQFARLGLAFLPGQTAYALPKGKENAVNLAAILPGSDPALRDEYILVSSHYDHPGKDKTGKLLPGAGDNASGVAALLEIAEYLSRSYPAKRSFLFIAFDREETGLQGSSQFAQAPPIAPNKIAACFNLDTFGRGLLELSEPLVFLAASNSYPQITAAFKQAASLQALEPLTIPLSPVVMFSDHYPLWVFWRRPTFFLTNGFSRDFHTPKDTLEKLNLPLVSATARAIAETLAQAGQMAALKMRPPKTLPLGEIFAKAQTPPTEKGLVLAARQAIDRMVLHSSSMYQERQTLQAACRLLELLQNNSTTFKLGAYQLKVLARTITLGEKLLAADKFSLDYHEVYRAVFYLLACGILNYQTPDKQTNSATAAETNDPIDAFAFLIENLTFLSFTAAAKTFALLKINRQNAVWGEQNDALLPAPLSDHLSLEYAHGKWALFAPFFVFSRELDYDILKSIISLRPRGTFNFNITSSPLIDYQADFQQLLRNLTGKRQKKPYAPYPEVMQQLLEQVKSKHAASIASDQENGVCP